MTAFAVVLVAAGGVGGAVQAALMGRWGERVGTLEAFAFASLLTALIGTALLLAGGGGLGGYAAAARQPIWLWTAGVMSALIVDKLPFHWERLLGIALLAAGAALSLKR